MYEVAKLMDSGKQAVEIVEWPSEKVAEEVIGPWLSRNSYGNFWNFEKDIVAHKVFCTCYKTISDRN